MDEEGHSGSVWNHRIPVIDSKQKSDPLFEKGSLPSQKRSRVL